MRFSTASDLFFSCVRPSIGVFRIVSIISGAALPDLLFHGAVSFHSAFYFPFVGLIRKLAHLDLLVYENDSLSFSSRPLKGLLSNAITFVCRNGYYLYRDLCFFSTSSDMDTNSYNDVCAIKITIRF